MTAIMESRMEQNMENGKAIGWVNPPLGNGYHK